MPSIKTGAQCDSAASVGVLGDGSFGRQMGRILRMDGVRFDSQNTQFLERDLLGMIAEVFKTVRPPRNSERWIPRRTWPGREYVRQTAYKQSDGTVKFEPYEGAGDDIPRASKKLGEKKHDVVGFHAGCFWTRDEIGAAVMLGLNLSQQGMDDLIEAWETKVNFNAWYGDATRDLSGLLSLPFVQNTQAQDSTGAALQITAASDPDEVVAFVSGMIDDVANNTDDSFEADTALFASAQYRIMQHSLRLSSTKQTVLQHLQETHPEVTFARVRELSNVDARSTVLTAGNAANIVTPAGSPTQNYCVALSGQARVIEQQIPKPVAFDPDLYRSGTSEWGLVATGRCGSTHNPQPGAVQVRYGI